MNHLKIILHQVQLEQKKRANITSQIDLRTVRMTW